MFSGKITIGMNEYYTKQRILRILNAIYQVWWKIKLKEKMFTNHMITHAERCCKGV
jgi:hypothetical protein